MSGVICAIRGGPHSHPTIDCAIDLAIEHDCPLQFLYAVNVEFLARASLSRPDTITKEMHHLGEFIVLAAQTAAEKRGIKASGVVREGDVSEEIIALCHETGADYVVVGRPHHRVQESVFTHDLLQKFADRIQKETGARVVYPEAGIP
jgi:nucleotide-binding universal stress UspA family protein